MTWMHQKHNVCALCKLQPGKVRCTVGRCNLDRTAGADNNAAVFVYPKIVVPKFEYIRLLHIELKRYEPDFIGAGFDFSNKLSAGAPRQAAMRLHQKVLYCLGAIVIAAKVCPAKQSWRQLTSCKVRFT